MQAWALLSKGDDDRVWESNDGYPDVLGSHYVYDSGVANHKRVRVGDLVVLRDSVVVHGVSRVDRIDSELGTKVRYVCPECKRTGFVGRKTSAKGRKNLCRHCRHEFDEPMPLAKAVTVYTAAYGAEWRPLDGAMAYSELAPLLDRAQQNAIRSCKPDGLTDALKRIGVSTPSVPPPRKKIPVGGHRVATVRVRNGQAEFRQRLLQRYGLVCAITGPCPAPVLEAAHLRAFASHGVHDPDEGLLLRSDIHHLFDAGLLAVNPTSMQVELAPSIVEYSDYGLLRGTTIASGTYVSALADHYDAVSASW